MIADVPVEMFHHSHDGEDWLPALMRAQLQFPPRAEYPFPQPPPPLGSVGPPGQRRRWRGHAGWEDRGTSQYLDNAPASP